MTSDPAGRGSGNSRGSNWFIHCGLYEHCGDIPPVEMETAYYSQHQRPAAG